MSRSFKIKKYWVLSFVMILCSLVTNGHDLNNTNRKIDNDTIQNIKSKAKVRALKNSGFVPIPQTYISSTKKNKQTRYITGIANSLKETSNDTIIKKSPGIDDSTKLLMSISSSNSDTNKNTQDNNSAIANTITLRTTGTNIQTVCLGTDAKFINYDITGTNNTVTLTGFPSGVSATYIGQEAVFISGRPTTVGVYNFKVTVSGSGGPSATATGTITVTNTTNPPSISLTSGTLSNNQTICLNSPITNITWSTSATGVTFTRLPPGVTGSFSGSTVTLSGTPTTTGSWDYIVNAMGGCGSSSASGMIIVNARHTVSAASSSPTSCINNSLPPITHTTTGATGIGTPSGLPSGVSASIASNIITINGTPTASGTFNYSIPVLGSCGSVNAIGTIFVNSSNSVSSASLSPTLCVNTALAGITHTTTGASGINNSGVSGANGLPNGVSATWASNTITISGVPNVTGTFNYSIPLSGGCGSVSATGKIVVNSSNLVSSASLSPTICTNTALTGLIHTTAGATGIANSNISGANGLPTGVSATWAVNTITISGTPTISGNFNYSIPLTGGCGTVNATGTIIVNPTAVISLTSTVGTNAQIKCINTPINDITYTSTTAGPAIYTGLPTGVTGSISPSNVATIRGIPTIWGTFPYTITFQGCGTPASSGTITVLPTNTILLASDSGTDNQSKNINTAIDLITYNFTGATNVGFSGLPAGVNGNFTSNTATISGIPTASGTYNYTVTLANGCGLITAQGSINVLCQPITGVIKIVKNTSYPLLFSAGKSTSALACEQTAFPVKFYTATATLSINTQLYLNDGLTQPVTSGSLWYQYKENATSYKVNNSGKIEEVISCVQTSPTTQTYLFYALHPLGHNGSDYVVYIDTYGIERTLVLTRTDNVYENPCQEIMAQRIIEDNGVGDCDSRG